MRLAAVATLLELCAHSVIAASPYPQSDYIESIDFDFSTEFQRGAGSDQWVMTWADDGLIYGAWGDGWGWTGGGNKQYMGVTGIAGSSPALSGTDVWGISTQNRKPKALIADENHLIYLFWGTDSDNWTGQYVSVSTDNGRSWANDTKIIEDSINKNMNIVGVAQFGPGYSNVPSYVDNNYFYIYMSAADGKDVYLSRVRKNSVLDFSAYEHFKGLDISGYPQWSLNVSARQRVFHDSAGMEYHINVSYNPYIERFLYAKGHSKSQLGIFEGTTPWGPWKTIYYGQFKDGYWKFTYQLPQKWMSKDGSSMWMAWSGWPEYDNVNFIKANLSLKNSNSDNIPPSPVMDFTVQ